MATIAFSLLPAPPTAEVVIDDKVLHASTYFVLASWFAGIYRPARYGLLAGLLLLLGGVLELLQSAGDTRLGEWFDLLANATGIVAGLLLARLGLAGWCRRLESVIPGAPHA